MNKKIYLLIFFLATIFTIHGQNKSVPMALVNCNQLLYAPGDYGSANWRIPAILALPDGTLIVANDKRKFNEADLPEDIDILVRRSLPSANAQRAWEEPVVVAQGTGFKQGFGDPGLVQTAEGDILCMFVGGNGFWKSNEEDPQRTYVSRSTDSGKSWGTPIDITSLLWGGKAENPLCRRYKGSFCASGNGLRLTRGPHAGRVMFVAAMCRVSHYVADNFVVYSDDNGATWHVSDLAFRGGDEAKVVQLVDGRILMSVRQNGARGYNISEDGGATWGDQGNWPEMTTNACNGDMIRYSSVDEGGERNILIHSIPNSMQRENVSLFVSYDEGKTWHDPLTLHAGSSVYSSLTRLPDGTIGIYLEKNDEGPCSLWYMNISFPW